MIGKNIKLIIELHNFEGEELKREEYMRRVKLTSKK